MNEMPFFYRLLEEGGQLSIYEKVFYERDAMQVFPDLSHYFGRAVEEVEDHELGWSINLEGNVRIVITDSVTPRNDAVVGHSFMRQDLSREGTTMWFGSPPGQPFAVKVIVRPDRYAISEPGYEGGKLVNPQQPVEYADRQRLEWSGEEPGTAEVAADAEDDAE